MNYAAVILKQLIMQLNKQIKYLFIDFVDKNKVITSMLILKIQNYKWYNLSRLNKIVMP